MTAIGTVASEIGLVDRPGERAVLAAVVEGALRHAYLSDAAALEADDDAYEALYVAGGLFRDGSIAGNKGRSAPNLTRVVYLQFDADLLDYLGAPDGDAPAKRRRSALLEELGRLPQAELDGQVAALRAAVEETFADCGVPIHRLDYTGYGLCAYVYVAEADQPRVDDAKAAHAHVWGVLDKRSPGLFDPAVKDAGTRITRLPGSYNRKGATPRLVTTLVAWDGSAIPLGQRPSPVRRLPVAIPAAGPGLLSADAEALVAALEPHWLLGQKHALALAFAALLAKNRIPEDAALAVVEALSAHDAKPWDRRSCVRSTYERARAGGPIAGYSRLVAMLPAETVAFVDRVLSKYGHATSGPVSLGAFELTGDIAAEVKALKRERGIADDVRDKRISDLFPLPPANAYFGSFGAWKDLMAPTTEAPEAFHLGVALTAFGAMMARRVCVEYASEPLYGNLYTALIGATGKTRKDTAIKRVIHVGQRQDGMRAVVPGFHVAKDVSSAEGIVNTLREHNNTLFYLTELSHLQKNAARKGTRTIMDRLIEAWDTPTVLENLTKGNPIQARNPFLSIIAATQPTRLADNMTDEDIESGFANRWLFIFGKRRPGISRPPAVDWRAAWDIYVDWYDAITSYPEGHVLRWDGSADVLWDEWYYGMEGGRSETDDEDAMSIRHPVLAQKLSLTFAVSERATAIGRRHLEAAIALIDWMWTVIRELMRGWGVGIDAQIELTVVQALKRFGPMYRRHLQQKCSRRRWSGRDFAAVFRAMQENGAVVVDANGIVALPVEDAAVRSSA